jgi:hypothetical protein
MNANVGEGIEIPEGTTMEDLESGRVAGGYLTRRRWELNLHDIGIPVDHPDYELVIAILTYKPEVHGPVPLWEKILGPEEGESQLMTKE